MLCLSPFFMIYYKVNLEKVNIRTEQYNQYTLYINQIGEPDWPFGKTHCQYILKDQNKTLSSVKFDISDDGCSASINNFKIEWTNDYMILTVRGSEQFDHYYMEELK